MAAWWPWLRTQSTGAQNEIRQIALMLPNGYFYDLMCVLNARLSLLFVMIMMGMMDTLVATSWLMNTQTTSLMHFVPMHPRTKQCWIVAHPCFGYEPFLRIQNGSISVFGWGAKTSFCPLPSYTVASLNENICCFWWRLIVVFVYSPDDKIIQSNRGRKTKQSNNNKV